MMRAEPKPALQLTSEPGTQKKSLLVLYRQAFIKKVKFNNHSSQ